MLPSSFRLVLVLLLASAAVAAPEWVSSAYAQDDDDDDDDDDPQPPVTSGGLFTKASFPVAELERPLTLIGGMFQIRAGLNVDISNENAFEAFRLDLLAAYGIRDWSEIQFGVDINAAKSSPDVDLLLAYEASIAYDLVNFRIGVDLIIGAAPLPDDTGMITGDKSNAFDIFFGFPFRYKPKPQIGIIALDKLMTIHTSSKPDLTVGLGLVFQAAPPVALILRADAIVTEFNFDKSIRIPATAAVQFSPNNKFDLGLEFTFFNLNTEDPLKPFDQRFLRLFGQLRL